MVFKKKHKLFFNSSEWIKIQKFINNEIETNYRFKKQGYNNNLYLDKKIFSLSILKIKIHFKKIFLETFSKRIKEIPKIVYSNKNINF